ncbi:MAG: sulfotransferase [Polyangiaceae bacterium]|nr:sulfotransferase [Polyangiaceae bacterium]
MNSKTTTALSSDIRLPTLSTDACWGQQTRAPLALRLTNGALSILPARRLTSGALIDAARRKTGLKDLGDEFFLPALDKLLESLHEEARLTPAGRLIQKKRITDLLANRLRLEEEFKKKPELSQTELLPPVMIAGLQRTGTTLLHRLLASHPHTRSLPSWEVLNPGPLPRDPENKRRKKLARQAEKGLQLIAPQFFAIHPIEADSVEEEVLLLELSFMSQTGEAIMRVPSYAAWLEAQDQKPAYDYMVKVLKLMQARTPAAKHWILKSPHHMEWLETAIAAMPELRIIQTHRNPEATVASFCSMVCHGQAVFSNQVNAHEVGRHWLKKIRRLTERTLETRRRSPDRFIDLRYEDLVEDPQRELKMLHEKLHWSIDENSQQALENELRHSRKGRFGQHHYSLTDFGLTPNDIKVELQAYLSTYGF